MSVRSLIAAAFQQKSLNFWLTNRIPRRAVTRLMGWFSKIEQPIVRDLSIAVWRLFCDLDLSDAKKSEFKSLHDCFVRELAEGARPISQDPQTLISPCDAIVGGCGAIAGTDLLQVKGSWYPLEDLLGSASSWSSTAMGATPRCVSPRRCTIASTLLTIAASSRSPTSGGTPGTSIRLRSSASIDSSAGTNASSFAPACSRRATL